MVYSDSLFVFFFVFFFCIHSHSYVFKGISSLLEYIFVRLSYSVNDLQCLFTLLIDIVMKDKLFCLDIFYPGPIKFHLRNKLL